MNYHNITKADMLNGDGLRVVLWVSGCNHRCDGCHNKLTWDCKSGVPFDINAKEELFKELEKEYISGVTFSGGDPLHDNNLDDIVRLIQDIKDNYSNKTIWLYTGYTFDEIERDPIKWYIFCSCDVVVDGRFNQELSDISYHWAGSTNQRVIDVKESLRQDKVMLWNS